MTIRRSLPVLFLICAAAQLSAQDTTRVPTGVRLSTRYNVVKKPVVAVQPIAGGPGQVTEILKRDLDFSDRVDVVETPQALATGPVDYGQWSSLNVLFVVAGAATPSGDGYQLAVTLHDVPFGKVKQTQTFALPSDRAPNFRMAVHAVADEIVRWVSGQRGSAATRVIYTKRARSGDPVELFIVDSDGENARRLLSAPFIYSPTWSPDGNKIAYAMRPTAHSPVELHERDLNTGSDRVISARVPFSYTPAYSPDGKRLLFSIAVGNGSEIQEYDLEKRCCLRRVTSGPRMDVAPSPSSDGTKLVFQSDRLGQSHIFVADVAGGQATLLTPYGSNVRYLMPDWSPVGSEIVFTGESSGGYQLMIADAKRPGSADQITETGNNEDPSWAPDGKHIVFSGVGTGGSGLYVIDRNSGRRRLLVGGAKLQMPEWSAHLAGAAPSAAGN
jgi:TolB protein